MTDLPEFGPGTWADYINAEADELMKTAGPELVMAMVQARAIEDPEFYARSKERFKDEKQAYFGITKAGYWEKVALRALVLLRIPADEREARVTQLCEEAKARSDAARSRIRAKLSKKPKPKTLEVDLSQIRI